jgi:hypothetical protein
MREASLGAEFVEVELDIDRLTASGVSVCNSPTPYRLDYRLETSGRFVTSRMYVTARGQGWKRRLTLWRSTSGMWTARRNAEGTALEPDDGELPELGRALDCDLGLSPLTNSMPVLRHGLLHGGGSRDFEMAWISVPDLRVHVSGQRYTYVRTRGLDVVIRYEATDSDFIAEITFDRDGLVVDYPGIGHRFQTPPLGMEPTPDRVR